MPALKVREPLKTVELPRIFKANQIDRRGNEGGKEKEAIRCEQIRLP